MRLSIGDKQQRPGRLKKLLNRRQVVKTMGGDMKSNGLLAKHWPIGATGDAPHAILCGVVDILRMIPAQLRVL